MFLAGRAHLFGDGHVRVRLPNLAAFSVQKMKKGVRFYQCSWRPPPKKKRRRVNLVHSGEKRKKGASGAQERRSGGASGAALRGEGHVVRDGGVRKRAVLERDGPLRSDPWGVLWGAGPLRSSVLCNNTSSAANQKPEPPLIAAVLAC